MSVSQYEEISAAEFNELFQREGEIVNIEYKRIRGEVKLINAEYTCSAAFIENCIFEEIVELVGLDLKEGIKFSKCKFHKYLTFSVCKATKIDFRSFDPLYSVVINDCTISESLGIGKCQLQRGISVAHSEMIKILCHENSIYEGDIKIDAAKVVGDLTSDFRYNKPSNGIRISNSEFHTNIKFENNIVGGYDFIKSTFHKVFLIWAGECKGNIIFHDGTYNNDVKIEAVKIGDGFSLKGTTFNKSLIINISDLRNKPQVFGEFKNLFIESISVKNQLEINDYDHVNKKIINKIELQFSSELEGDIKFYNIKAKEISLTGSNYNSALFINNSEFNKIELNEFSNYSKVVFNTITSLIKKTSSFYILDSYLNGVSFSNFDFNDFSKIVLKGSSFANIECSNLTWFKPKKLQFVADNDLGKFIAQRELYMQLKGEMKNQGNNIQARKFRHQEMKAHHWELKNIKAESNREKFSNWLDRFLLWTSRSNTYGENWLKPAGLAILFTLFIYFFIMVSLDTRLEWRIAHSWQEVGLTFKYYCENIMIVPILFNPAHSFKFDEVLGENANITGATLFFDFLQRILMSYFIYQTIVAFRKYTG